MYSFSSRIRYSELDDHCELTLHSLINFFQDCSTFQSESLGRGLSYMEKKHRAWLLSSWQIEIARLPKLGEEVLVGTFPYDFKAFYGYRNFFLKDAEGNFLVKANSIWFHMDVDSGRPVKPDAEDVAGYEPEEKLSMEYAGRKLPALKEGTKGEPIVVRKYHLDSNHHVNNGQYIAMAQEFLPEGIQIHKIRIEYKQAAVYGDVIYPLYAKQGEEWMVSLENEAGQPYAVAAFS